MPIEFASGSFDFITFDLILVFCECHKSSVVTMLDFVSFSNGNLNVLCANIKKLTTKLLLLLINLFHSQIR